MPSPRTLGFGVARDEAGAGHMDRDESCESEILAVDGIVITSAAHVDNESVNSEFA